MTNITSNNKRIAKNTLFLYLRTLIIMLVSLYTTRVVIKALGDVDYGIYTAVGSFVAMFAMISNSLTSAISRFITYELGLNNKDNIRKVFSTAIILQFIICALIIIMAIPIGMWMINTKMVIPPDRLSAANWVFVLSLLTFIINLISIPYNALIIANEKMNAFAYIGILDAFGRLFIAYAINISSYDSLIQYAILMSILAIIIRFLYSIYCKINFKECYFVWNFNKELICKIFGFTGWNFVGAAAGVLKEQGINVLLNIFCGPIVNTARGIAVQVTSAITQFVTGFTTALNPQITKSYAAKNYNYTIDLVNRGARLSFLLLFILSFPIIAEAGAILRFWLDEIPEHSINFVRLVLINSMIDSISYPLITLMLANGNIRNYQIIVGGCLLLNFPISYIFLKLGFFPEIVFFISISISVTTLILRLVMLSKMVRNFKVGEFLSSVMLRVMYVTFSSLIILLLIYNYIKCNNINFIIKVILLFILALSIVYKYGLVSSERQFIKNKAMSILNKKK